MVEKTIYIPDDAINKYDEDRFGHKHIADAVIDSIQHTKPPYIIGIFGGWGTGKSSLIQIIKNELKKKHIESIIIDAWRYTSAENLRRAFLIHVANALSSKDVDKLQVSLYSSQQTTIPGDTPINTNKTPFWKRLWKNLCIIVPTFIILTLLFLILLLLIFSIKELISIKWIWGNFSLDTSKILDKYLDLAFIPLLLSLVEFFRLNIIQPPVTIMKEKINADELFTNCFEDVIKEATKNKDKLVIFIDNLDRLSNEKMVEALESLKTYINNEKCIFIVACDDYIVRKVIDTTEEREQNQEKPGEHYLDKFFQQTFRLPEYRNLDLQDFGVNIFCTTELSEVLNKNGINPEYIVSVLIPTDVKSPRKVKRLINEFIATYEIVKRKETQSIGQLRPGLLTGNLDFLGKISTIRAEFPLFYSQLILKPTLLTEITEELPNSTDEILKEAFVQSSSLISYLRKTGSILVEDIEPFLWLSQDQLSLGITSENYDRLLSGLSNGDTNQIKTIIGLQKEIQEKELFEKEAVRIVEQKLRGINKFNGIKVLSHLLPEIQSNNQVFVALSIIQILPYTLDDLDLPIENIFNIIHWANISSTRRQKDSLFQQIIQILEKEIIIGNYEEVFNNFNVIVENRKIKDFEKSINNAIDISAKTDHTFAEWLVDKSIEFRKDQTLFIGLFNKSLVSYSIARLLGDYLDKPEISIEEDGLGRNIKVFLNTIEESISSFSEGKTFIEELTRLIKTKKNLIEINFSIQKILNFLNKINIPKIDDYFIEILESIKNILAIYPTLTSEPDLINQIFENIYKIIVTLRRQNNKPLSSSTINEFSEVFPIILNIQSLIEQHLTFINHYANEFDTDEISQWILGLSKAFEQSQNIECKKSILHNVKLLEKHLTRENTEPILSCIDINIKSNQSNEIENAYEYLQIMIDNSIFVESISQLTNGWLNLSQDFSSDLINAKLNLFRFLNEKITIDYEAITNSIIEVFPLPFDDDRNLLYLDELQTNPSKISHDSGMQLFQKSITGMSFLGSQTVKTLYLIGNWLNIVSIEERQVFHEKLRDSFIQDRLLCMKTLEMVSNQLSIPQIQEQMETMYKNALEDNEFLVCRKKTTRFMLNQLNQAQVSNQINNVWDTLLDINDASENFMEDVLEFFNLEDLKLRRKQMRDSIRADRTTKNIENCFRFISSTNRKDMHSVKPVIEVFNLLWGGRLEEYQIALDYSVRCLRSIINWTHKYSLAQTIGRNYWRIAENIIPPEKVYEVAKELGLSNFDLEFWRTH